MPQTKPDYMLVERGRYYYQRKVPLDLQPTVGRKKWRAPLGKDFEKAYDKLRTMKRGHDELIERLSDTEERQIFRTVERRRREIEEADRLVETDAAYEKWCRDNCLKTEEEEYFDELERLGLVEEPPWETAER